MTDPIIQQMQEKAREKSRTLLSPGIGVRYLTSEDVDTLIATAVRAGYEARDREVREIVEAKRTKHGFIPLGKSNDPWNEALDTLLTHLNSKV